MATSRSVRIVFVVAVSFCAATLGDAMLEAVSNSGVLWRGHYTDKSSLNLLPTCALAILALFVAFCLIVREQGTASGSFRALMYSMSRTLRRRSVVRLLPVIATLQFATLFAMETVEQTIVYGHPLGGSLWLGAPTVVALIAHIIIGSVGAFGIASALTLSAERLVRIVRSALTDLLTPEGTHVWVALRQRSVRGADDLLRFARRSKRGPPTPAVFTT